jgi:hypothetical protein
MSECTVSRTLNIRRVGKKNGPLADRKIGGSRTSVLSGPGVNSFEENFVRFEQIGIGKLINFREALKSSIDAG